jgi:hypothetical protein
VTVLAGEYWVGRESVSNLVQYLRTMMKRQGTLASPSGEHRESNLLCRGLDGLWLFPYLQFATSQSRRPLPGFRVQADTSWR